MQIGLIVPPFNRLAVSCEVVAVGYLIKVKTLNLTKEFRLTWTFDLDCDNYSTVMITSLNFVFFIAKTLITKTEWNVVAQK